MTSSIFLLAVTLIVPLDTVTSTSKSNDWPEFRGPKRDGICLETGLLQEWPESGPPKLWTAKNLGEGFSSPTIVGGKIYGMGTRDGKDGVWALNQADGSAIWFTPIDQPREVNQNNGPSGSVTYSDGKLYAVSSLGKLVCLNAADGKLIWGADYRVDYKAEVPWWGFTDSPLIDGQNVLAVPASDDAAVVAFDKDSGKEIWTTKVDGGVGAGAGYSSVIKATIGGAPQYVLLLGNKAGLIGINPDSGKVLWQYKGQAATGGVAQIPIPIVYNSNVLVSCAYDGGTALLEITGDGGKFNVKPLKTYKKPQLNNHHGGMVQVGDYAYFGHDQNNGKPVCVDLRTGDIQWGPERNPAKGRGSASVLYADRRLYFCYQNGVMVLIEPSPEELKVVSSFNLPDPSGKEHWPHPVIVNGKLYMRDQDNLHCFDVKAK